MFSTDCRKVNEVTSDIDPMIFNQLQEFRHRLYGLLGNARDAVFDLMDAVLVSASISSFVSLSQSPVFRRQWSSTYAALQASRLPQRKITKLLVSQIATDEQPLLAGDSSRWKRASAKTLQDRSFAAAAGSGITVGHSYSSLAWIPEAEGSWALPVCHGRMTSFETPVSKAAVQLEQVTRQMRVRPLAVYERGYGNASFVTWSSPGQTLEVEEAKLGRVRLTRWSEYHFRKFPNRSMQILRVEVLGSNTSKRRFQPLWLAWLGKTIPLLEHLWLKYLRRFALEHGQADKNHPRVLVIQRSKNDSLDPNPPSNP
jgi:hypothetical protein